MSAYWPFIVPGLVNGSVYALAAAGLVLTYRTTGTFNLAFGAQAYVSAVVYYELRVNNGWGLVPGLLVAVVVVGPCLGLLLDRLVFRHLRGAATVVRLGVGIGLLIAIPAVVAIASGGATDRFAPPSVGPQPVSYVRWGAFNIDSDQLVVLIATFVVVASLLAFLQLTAIGLRMRAVVESPRMAELSGVDAGHVNTVAWVVSSAIAGLVGVLLAPLFATLEPMNYTLLVVAAIAAAVLGRLSSISLAVLGGLLLGVLQSLLVKWLPLGSTLAQGLRPSLPFVMLFALLLVLPGLGARSRSVDPLSGVDPPSRPATAVWDRQLGLRTQIGLLVGAPVAAALVLSDHQLHVGARALIFSTIFLSITLLTGLSGHISLCHATFVGIGAFVAGQLAVQQELSVVVGALVGGVVAAIAGVLLAIPSLRIGGIFLALATLAFGLFADNVLFVQSWALGDVRGLDVPRPVLGPLDLASNRAFFLLCALLLGAALGLMHVIRRGATGALLVALRGSEVGAQSVGLDPTPLKVKVFALSAGMAGVAGGLLGSLQGSISSVNFVTFQSLYWIVVILAVGVYTARGAVVAGFVIVYVPELVSRLPEQWALLQFVVFGLGVLVLARHPEGALEHVLSLALRRRSRSAHLDPAAAAPTEATAAAPGRGQEVPQRPATDPVVDRP
jgi:branched-chain amino acid transport system permease protein